MPVWLERVLIGVASLLLSVGLIAVLSGFFAGRDQAGVAGTAAGNIGQRFADLGHAHLQPGEPRPAYNSSPPTSGAHMPALLPPDGAQMTDDQLLQALEVGDVVILYGQQHPSRRLQAFAASFGSYTPQLEAAGGAVVLARKPGTRGLIALAWTRSFRVSNALDPLLKQFVTQWLGRGAPGR